ncbi:MAG TPA: glycosyltransferase family A protein, partial [Marmoricola sp.]
MPSKTGGRQLARAVDRWLPPASRRLGREALRRLRPPAWRDRAVTVVIVVDDDDTRYVGEALDSLAGQTHAWFTAVVVPFGESRAVMAEVRRRAWSDTRIVPLRAVSGSRGAAYDRGARRARAPYLMFMDGRDVLPPRALDQLVGTLATTGSDLAVGLLEQAPQVVRSVAAAPPAHREDRLGVTVEQFPIAITDTHEQNRLYRTSFWRAAGLAFEDGSGERTPAVDAYFAARAFDVIRGVTYVRMNRGPGSPFGQEHNSFDEFDGWLAGQDAMLARLGEMEAAAAARLRESWLAAGLEEVAQTFLEDAERATDEQWTSLRAHVAEAAAGLSPESRRQMAAEAKVRIALLLADRRAELSRFVAARWFQYGNRPTLVRDGRVYAELPFFGDADVGLPDDTFEMSEAETPLAAVLRTVRWDGAALELGLVAYIDFVDLDETPAVEVDLVDAATGERFPLAVEQFTDHAFAQRALHRFQNYDRGGVRLRLDAAWLDELAERSADGRREFVLDLTVSHRGVTRRGPVTERDDRGTGGRLQEPATAARHGVTLVPDDRAGLRIRAGLPRQVRLTEASVSARRVALRIHAGEALAELVATHPEAPPAVAPVRGTGPEHEVVLDLPALAGPAARTAWQVQARTAEGRLLPVWFAEGADEWLGLGRDVVVARSATGGTRVVESAGAVVLDRCELVDDGLVVAGRWLGRPADGARLELRGRRTTVTADVPAEPSFEAVFGTRWNPWDLQETRIPWDE